jgi:hypothetical protein
MFGTLVVVAMEASIIAMQGGTEIMLQMQKTLKSDKSFQSEGDLVRVKFAALQRAFKDAYNQSATAKELRAIVLANYQRLLAAEGV